MAVGIIELREFYQSPRGRAASNILAPVLQRHMADAGGAQRMTAVYGYVPHGLLSALPDVVMMPASQGVAAWPSNPPGAEPNRAVLVEEHAWPLADQSCDTLVMMHALENGHDTHRMLAEAWRVLKGHGRLVLVVPNRRGLWSRAEGTPFGHGQPFTALQLRTALHRAQFVAERWERTLFTPPFKSSTLLATSAAWEAAGRMVLPTCGGLIVMNAAKQLYAPTGLLRAAQAPAFSIKPGMALPAN